ncbi:MAG: gliding motility-associated C-terminal domain-containing protein [Bacteroidales bacterium]
MKMNIRFLNILILLAAFTGLQAQNITLVSLNSTPVTCGGGSDGTITIEVDGGSGNLNYTLFFEGSTLTSSGFIPDRTYTFLNLSKSADYTIYVADAVSGTTNLFVDASVGGPDTIKIVSTTITDITCATFNDGTITTAATGEDGNLIYDLTGPVNETNSTGFFESLPTGNYTVSVSHGSCPSTHDTTNLFIDEPPPLTISTDNITPATCFQGNDGSIEITPAGGTPSGSGTGYTYSWTGPNGFTSANEDIFGLEAGDYTVEVTDANGCTEILGPLSVGEGTEITITTVNSTNVTCFGDNDGTATITVAGGTAPYTFSWIGQATGATSTVQNPANLVADTYDLTVTDDVGCDVLFTAVVTITQPDPIAVNIESITHVSCIGESDGSADITVSGGTLPYSYSWTATGPYTSTDEDPTTMPADTYSLEVTDGNGCIQNFPNLLVITEPEDITAVLDGFTDVTCFGGNDGTAQVTVDKGTPGYSYLWTGDVTGHTSIAEDPTDLITDTYDLQITDANSCVKVFNDIVTIDQPSEITTTITIVGLDCSGESTGEISITPSGGTAPYTFFWTGPDGFTSTDEDLTDIPAGSYDLTITDAQGCVKEFNNNIVSENNPITATFVVTHLTCNGSGDGAIDATVSGGTPPYAYAWSGNNGYTNYVDEDISGLDAGSYTLTITDDLGCIEVFLVEAVTEPDPLAATFESTDLNCIGSDDGTIDAIVTGGTQPYSYAWTGPGGFSSTDEDLVDLEPGDYSLDITDVNNCFISYPNAATIEEPTEIAVIATATDITCNGAADGTISIVTSGGTPGYNFAWSGPNGFSSSSQNLSSLEPGTYDLTVTDFNGCVKAFPGIAILTEPTAIDVTFTGQSNLGCFGDNNGSITIDVTGGTPPYLFSWTDSTGTEVSADEDPVGLVAGTYSLEVTDDVSCVVTYPDAVVLTEPTQLISVLSKTDVLCAGQADGTITATTSEGTPPYEYSFFSGGPYSSNNEFTGLSNGTYRVYTRDANGCRVSSTITIEEPDAINYEYGISGQNLCNGDSNVTITINNVTGGIAPYEYSIDGGITYQSNSVFTNLPGGSYPVVVRDSNLCEQGISPLTILEPSRLRITFYDQDDITTCYDAEEGRIAIQGSGGTGSIKYSLNGGALESIGEFTDLPGGVYLVSMVDANLCQKDTVVEILRPDEIIFDLVNITNVTGCPGDNNGRIEVSATGGTGAKSYSLDGGSFNPSGIFNNLTAGDYTVTTRDGNGCTRDTTLTVSEPSPMIITSETATETSCFGTSTGTITVEVSGGTPAYTFTLDPPVLPPQNNETFSGLPAGDYTVNITDSEGCGPVTSGVLTITDPPEFVLDSVTTTQITCNGENDGSITIFVAGGTAPYEYSIDNEVTYTAASLFTDLGPGAYDVFARDSNSCSLFAGTWVISEPPILDLNVIITNITSCSGDTTGAISATASGGWGIYEYSLDGINFQASGDFTGLAAGDYTVSARDTGSCLTTEAITINEPAPVAATISKTDYVEEALGTITISDVSGGTPPYEYSIDGQTGTFTTNTSYTDLEEGTYPVVVKDANGCIYEEFIEIFNIIPLDMVINSTDVSCFGYDNGIIEFQPQNGSGTVQFSIDSGVSFTTSAIFENLPGDSIYNLQAFDEDGKQYEGTVYIKEPAKITVFKNISPANCNAFSETGSVNLTVNGGTGVKTFNWSNGSTNEDLSGVVAGKYYVEITDENGCVVNDSAVVGAFVVVTANAGKDTTICAGTSIKLEAVAGSYMNWSPATFLSDTNIANPVASNVFDSISYAYRVTEANSGFGCYNVDTVRVNVLPVYGLEISSDTSGVAGETIQLESTTTGNIVSYQWAPETGLDETTVPNPIATLQSTITYQLIAINDYGCVESASVTISVVEDITVYNVFSPNGDMVNDYFEIENASIFPEIQVEVYTRWGSRIYYSEGYSDDKRWDGTFNGKDVPTGTYYYVIIPKPDATPITGNVTIIR